MAGVELKASVEKRREDEGTLINSQYHMHTSHSLKAPLKPKWTKQKYKNNKLRTFWPWKKQRNIKRDKKEFLAGETC